MSEQADWENVVIGALRNRERYLIDKYGFMPTVTDEWVASLAKEATTAAFLGGKDRALDCLTHHIREFEDTLGKKVLS